MTHHVPDQLHAVAARGAAMRRVRRVTGAAVAITAALAGIFTALAAGSTHPRRAVQPGPSTPPVRVPRLGPVVAPAPPLVGVREAAPAPPPSSSAPSPVPTPVPSSTPVVVSGGS